MPAEDVAKLRNVAIVGQGGAGKTTVADALLFAAGASTRLGRVDDGSSAFDTEPEEVRRKSSITASLHHAQWRKHDLNLIDTPGYSAFLHDTHNCLRAATGAVLVLGSTGGEIKIETEKVWAFADEWRYPNVIPQSASLKWWDWVLTNGDVGQAVHWSFVTAPVVTLIAAVICLPAAYSFSRFRFPGRRALFISLLAANAFPKIGLYVAIATLFYRLGLMGTYWGVVLVQLVGTLVAMVWIPAAVASIVGRKP